MWSLLSGDGQASRLRAAAFEEHDLLENWGRHFLMKQLLLALSILALASIPGSIAQTSDANQEQKLLALIKEVQTQQAQMAENQKQIEAKLTDIGETIRTARIYAGRSQ